MRMKNKLALKIGLLSALVILSCGSQISHENRSPFYAQSSNFEDCLIQSSRLYQDYIKENGPAFIITDEVDASNPEFIRESFYSRDQIHLRSYHTGGYEHIFRKQIMIPSMGCRWGDPLALSSKGKYNLAKRAPVLFCDNTVAVNHWLHIVEKGKNGPISVGSGKKTEHLYSGLEPKYFWKSEMTIQHSKQVRQFSSWVAPNEGVAIFMILNDDMHSFLAQLKQDYPKEFENWLGNDGKLMHQLNWLTEKGITKKWQYHSNATKLVKASEWLRNFDFEALRLAFNDYDDSLQASLSIEYTLLEELNQNRELVLRSIEMSEADFFDKIKVAQEAKRKILLANPLLKFDEILAIRRHKIPGRIRPIGQGPDPAGQASNYQSLSMVNRNIWDNALITIPIDGNGEQKLVYQSQGNRYIGKVDLHYDADKVLISKPNENMTYQVFELELNTGDVRQVSQDVGGDVDNYDACYLPSGEIIFASTACYHGVPCVNGNSSVANLCRIKPDGSEMRMLCFDQDDNWHPSVLNNGKVMYTRWEYTDSPHFFTRILMSMNPDGTNQRAYYGSNSYWPNSIFFARAVPDDPGKVIGVVSGHHGTRRAGELYLFDPSKGRHETDGIVQQIPGRNKKVEPIVADRLVDMSWPKFLHPYPLSDKYTIVSCQLGPFDNWGIYLVDVHDNMTLLSSDPYYHLLEPVPLQTRTTPPVIPDRINLESKDASVYIQNVYFGPGLKDIPSGEVKSLRLFEWHYAYRGTGGHTHVGIDGPWEPRRILGTVPVYEDGSAHFTVPANTPIAIQPLDEEGRALQIMRSWFTAMPGERISCVGCHEDANQVPPARPTLGARKSPVSISEWKGPERAYGFEREVQSVLDRLCVSCHDGSKEIPDFSQREDVTPLRNNGYKFTSSYAALHPYVRRPGPENDYHLSNPMEYHADQTELVQLLKKGHHNVVLDDDAWERIYTWIDLNVPDHATWTDHTNKIEPFIERRRELREMFAGIQHNPETKLPPIPSYPVGENASVDKSKQVEEMPELPNWPFGASEAEQMLKENANPLRMSVDLGSGVDMDLVLIPAGSFIQGRNDGPADEYPAHKVEIEEAFYMAEFETSLEQYLQFDPEHKQGVVNWTNKDQGAIGYSLDKSEYPVIRISWDEVQAYCEWLSEKSGYDVSLLTEAEWEWACRAGLSSEMNYGGVDSNFGIYANLADMQIRKWARRESPSWQPRIDHVDDGNMIFSEVGSYKPNVWGLYDMHGNAAEWTESPFEGYPGNVDLQYADSEKIVARGGSWYDRPYRATSGYRLDFEKYQKVHNVGFRVILRKK